jgi:hypothetical protein
MISYFKGEYKFQLFENKTFIKISDLRRWITALQQRAGDTVNKACLCTVQAESLRIIFKCTI